MELAYFSGYFRLKARQAGGAGMILRFERVRPRHQTPFQPLRSREVTPEFLDRLIRALKRWKFDIVGIDEACQRAVTRRSSRRFICLTFDGGYKDLIDTAYPVLSSHGVPFALYLPSAFPDGLGAAWWVALEDIIARENRVSLVIDRNERHFTIRDAAEKYDLYEFLAGWLRTLAPPDLAFAINDLCKRYSVDLAALSRGLSMDWDDLARLAADPLATIGSATVNYPVLAHLKDVEARREMTMGKAVLQITLQREVRHFAYPFGERGSFRRQHTAMAEEAGFASAATAIAGVIEPEGRTNLYMLPRVPWDGTQCSLRMMRVMLSGMALAPPRSPAAGTRS